MALARKVVAEVRSLWRSHLTALISFSQLPTRTVEVFIHLLRRGGRQGGDDKARVVASGHHLGFEDDPPWLGPGRRGIGKLRIQAAAGGRGRAMGLRQGGPLLVQMACFLQDGFGVAEQDGIAGEAEDEIDQRPMGDAPRSPPGCAKWLSPRTRIWVWGQWRRRKARSRTKIIAFSAPVGRVPGRRQAVTNAPESPSKMNERQIAIILIIMIVERELLLAVGRIVCVIEVEHDGRRRLRVAGDEVGDQRLGSADRGPYGPHCVQAARRLAHSPGPAREPEGSRSTPSLNSGSRRRLLASLPSA